MAFPVIEQVQTVASAGENEGDLKLALSRMAIELSSQYQAGLPTSADFMTSAIEALKVVSGDKHADLRINCLVDASHFFYLIGRTFDAIEPSLSAVDLATRVNNKVLLRKAL